MVTLRTLSEYACLCEFCLHALLLPICCCIPKSIGMCCNYACDYLVGEVFLTFLADVFFFPSSS